MGARIQKSNKVQKKKWWLQSKMTLKLRGGKIAPKTKAEENQFKIGLHTTHLLTRLRAQYLLDDFFVKLEIYRSENLFVQILFLIDSLL